MGNSKCDDYRKKEPARYRVDVELITADYNSGTLRVPCVTLRCIKFDEELVVSLAEARVAQPLIANIRNKRKHSEVESATPPVSSSSKRVRDTATPSTPGSATRHSSRIRSQSSVLSELPGEDRGRSEDIVNRLLG